METTANDLRQLLPVIDNIENPFRKVYKNISGGFVRSYIDFYHNDYFIIELWFGCQSDCDNTINHEIYLVDRKTFNIK